MKTNRPRWSEYFMKIATLVASRSTCLRRQVGAIIVKDNQIISTGYNGAPKSVVHCSETGCLRKKLNVPAGERHELCRGVHAEQNAIIQAAVNGVSIKDATIFCTHQPCSICAKMIINAEINTVYIGSEYPDKLGEEMFHDAGVQMTLYNNKTRKLKRII
ncbi:MAG: cytidine/deoxycytidylate deaminase family protein [Candidatus Cloacimonetes bacterium]|nr:cytidine/deoxycytidylate deaminase family protein [Candidatus Cloacimonadota bacterium]